ncbi:hypothetical protein PF008_g369 [Phytophthora fragariae]|uniref:Uncharacterized protein n=1 Tax=Phytophthora fragariae TaxID=53985 RepID=A0A6G0SP97_9STRA|nr:hypothetical protein PF008_g369 [Phytophthora fragariae]
MMADEEPRSLQQVIPVCDRVRCTNWMELDKAPHGSKGLYGRAVDFFPALFRSSDRRVNMNKARDWWSKREHTAVKLAEPNQLKYSTASQRVRHQIVVKALGGRGRELGAHWEWLYPLMLVEFRRLRRTGVKMSNQLVAEMGVVFIEDSKHHVFNVRLSVNDQLSRKLKAIVELYSDSFEEGYKEGANSVSL